MKIVRDILKQKGAMVWTAQPKATVREALTEMAAHDVGALIVTERDEVVGVISERDYARKVIVQGKSSLETSVEDIMTTLPTCVTPDQTIGECMRQMTENRIRHLPVLEGIDLIGIISIGDVVAAIIGDHESKIDELESMIFGC